MPEPSNPSNAARLREFHRAACLTSPERPTVPGRDLLTLRRTLIREEATEVEGEWSRLEDRLRTTELGAAEPHLSPADLAPLAHELVDLLYVTYGALDALGIDADAVFAEVHHANMAKLSGPRRADGKLLKPEGWQPADVRRAMGV